MSLKPRLRGLEARVEWLQDWGELRKCAQQFRYLEAKDKIIAQAPELAMRLGWIPARPKPEARPQPPPPPPPPPQPPKAESPHPEAQARRAQARGAAPQGEVVPPPPRAPPEPPPEPPTEPPTGPVVQPFEPIQSGLLRWRVRGPQDDWDDDEDSSDDEDYDVLADDL